MQGLAAYAHVPEWVLQNAELSKGAVCQDGTQRSSHPAGRLPSPSQHSDVPAAHLQCAGTASHGLLPLQPASCPPPHLQA